MGVGFWGPCGSHSTARTEGTGRTDCPEDNREIREIRGWLSEAGALKEGLGGVPGRWRRGMGMGDPEAIPKSKRGG